MAKSKPKSANTPTEAARQLIRNQQRKELARALWWPFTGPTLTFPQSAGKSLSVSVSWITRPHTANTLAELD